MTIVITHDPGLRWLDEVDEDLAELPTETLTITAGVVSWTAGATTDEDDDA